MWLKRHTNLLQSLRRPYLHMNLYVASMIQVPGEARTSSTGRVSSLTRTESSTSATQSKLALVAGRRVSSLPTAIPAFCQRHCNAVLAAFALCWYAGKDLFWYAKDKKDDAAAAVRNELAVVKAREEELMMEVGLSYGVVNRAYVLSRACRGNSCFG